jgi:adenosylcobinamide-GDP ribazoletransferase
MSVRRAVAFLTPMGGAAPPSPAAVAWFPAVGALVGFAVGGVWWLAGEAFPPVVAAVIAVAADLAFTGLLHIDGLVDTADGLLAPMDRERRMAVMAEPGVGAFGVAAAAVVVPLRIACLASIAPTAWLVAGLWCAARTVMAVALRTLRYARPGGLAQSFRGGSGAVVGAYGLGGACALAAVAIGLLPGVASVVAGVAGAGLVLWLAARRIGGFTGDVLGAAGVVAESVGLVVASARW